MCLHLFLLNSSALTESPVGGNITFEFIVRMLLGHSGCSLWTAPRVSTARGLEFNIASVSVIRSSAILTSHTYLSKTFWWSISLKHFQVLSVLQLNWTYYPKETDCDITFEWFASLPKQIGKPTPKDHGLISPLKVSFSLCRTYVWNELSDQIYFLLYSKGAFLFSSSGMDNKHIGCCSQSL